MNGNKMTDLKSELKQVSDQFVNNYGSALQDIICDPEEEPVCSNEKNAARSSLEKYKELANKSFQLFDKMSCLTDSGGLPDLTCNILPESSERRKTLAVDYFPYKRSLQDVPIPTDLVLVENRGM